MFQRSVPHHNTGGFISHRQRLPDKEYGEALDSLVKGCSDMLLLSPDGDTILLGRRSVQPQPDWWFAGGRIFPGETPAQSCGRLLSREFGLVVDPARFQVVCCQSLAWGMREQPPRNHGTTDIQVLAAAAGLTARIKVCLRINSCRLERPQADSGLQIVIVCGLRIADWHRILTSSLIVYGYVLSREGHCAALGP